MSLKLDNKTRRVYKLFHNNFFREGIAFFRNNYTDCKHFSHYKLVLGEHISEINVKHILCTQKICIKKFKKYDKLDRN